MSLCVREVHELRRSERDEGEEMGVSDEEIETGVNGRGSLTGDCQFSSQGGPIDPL